MALTGQLSNPPESLADLLSFLELNREKARRPHRQS